MLNKYLTPLALMFCLTCAASEPIEGLITELSVNNLITSGAIVGTGAVFNSACRPGADQSVKYFIIDFSDPGMQEAYSLALSAAMAKRPVRMVGDPSNCHGQFEKLKFISLK